MGLLRSLCGLTATLAAAQLPMGSNGEVLRCRNTPGLEVKYKETHICETTPGVKAYAGYVTLPATLDPEAAPYASRMFFWFFEARSGAAAAPLTVWLQGGPGAASTDQAVSGHNGPCAVLPGSRSTRSNPHSWNARSNMLYVDQPAQTGFTHDEVVPGVLDMLTGEVDVGPGGGGVPLNWTAVRGRFSSQLVNRTAHSTNLAARAVVEFLGLWMEEFKQYRRDEINIWSQSYGGHYAPAIASRILTHKGPGRRLGVRTVGIINGLVDIEVQGGELFPRFAVNNTYGIAAYNQSVADGALAALNAPGGCRDTLAQCRRLAAARDPEGFLNDAQVTAACGAAFEVCWGGVYFPYEIYSGRNPFDIGHFVPDPFPPVYSIGYLNRPEVQSALGVPVNYTESSNVVQNAFIAAGDFMPAGPLQALGALLDQGVDVALIYGDRDFRCNWFGGEAISLALPYRDSAAFAAAGYADISAGGDGGAVRQRGGLSFSRIYQAGHEVPFYQPALARTLFERVLAGRDIATGRVDVRANRRYATAGPASVLNIRHAPPAQPRPECYVAAAPLSKTCSDRQIAALLDGSAVVEDLVVVRPAP